MNERKSVKSKSGNIVSAGYDPQGQKMHVEFSGGGLYEYEKVSPEQWTSFEATFDNEDTSTGSYFHSNFRKSHKATKIG